MRHADVALYAAKAAKVGYATYDPTRDQYERDRITFGQDVRGAIERDELVLDYQPVVALRGRRLMGVEALVRWKHPERGIVPPADFIPMLERLDLSGALTEWALRKAVAQVCDWRSSGLSTTIAVNLSAQDLADEEFPLFIAGLLQAAHLSSDSLNIEVTESAIMSDPETAASVVGELDRLGVRCAIDDFGTGHSSLAYLARLPVSSLKIDRSFIRTLAVDERTASIVQATIDLAHRLGFTVVAEGIEDEDALRRLIALGCDFGQGYHIGPPMTAKDIHAWAAQARSAWATSPLGQLRRLLLGAPPAA